MSSEEEVIDLDGSEEEGEEAELRAAIAASLAQPRPRRQAARAALERLDAAEERASDESSGSSSAGEGCSADEEAHAAEPLSEYEQQRRRNMRANAAVLAELGLGGGRTGRASGGDALEPRTRVEPRRAEGGLLRAATGDDVDESIDSEPRIGDPGAASDADARAGTRAQPLARQFAMLCDGLGGGGSSAEGAIGGQPVLLGPDALRHAIASLGLEIPSADVSEMVDAFDEGGKGALSHAEFGRIIGLVAERDAERLAERGGRRGSRRGGAVSPTERGAAAKPAKRKRGPVRS